MFEKIRNRTVFCSNSFIFLGVVLCLNGLSCSSKREPPSPLRKDSVQMDNTLIKLEYSSPGVKGRDIFGIGSHYLEPYKELWRTGANKSSSIEFDQNIIIDTLLIPKGKYSIFTIPDAKTWIVILNKDYNQWGSSYYQDSLDVARFKVNVGRTAQLQERMKLYLEDDSLKFNWEYVKWSIPLAIP